jgi:two-component system sensor histidine kinase/response regulator
MPPELADIRHRSVLVVDDNATTRHILAELLTHWHWQPTLCDSASAALAASDRAKRAGHPFALALVDAQLPETDGLVVAEQLARHVSSPNAIIMMLSPTNQPGDAARRQRLQVGAYVMKPILPPTLLEAIKQALTAAPESAERPPSPSPQVTRGDRHALRILLAEDNVVNQMLVMRLLEKRGHTVVVAATGREALAALAREAFDLILMDVQMPEMDGFEATAAIRAEEPKTGTHIPIIAMTAHAMAGDQQRCLDAGMDDYISKPIQVQRVFAAIDRVCAAIR